MEFVAKNQRAEDAFTSLAVDVILGSKSDLSIFKKPTILKIIEKNLTERQVHSEMDLK